MARYCVLVVLCSVLVGCVGAQARRNAPECVDAVQRVRAYRAPGAPVPLGAAVTANVTGSGRPAQVEGWEPAELIAGRCYVYLRATIGNERKRLAWWLDPKTGQIAAWDAETKRYSGW